MSRFLLAASALTLASPCAAAPDVVRVPGGTAAVRRLLSLDTRRPPDTFFVEVQEALLSDADPHAPWDAIARRAALVGFLEDLASWRKEFGEVAVFGAAEGRRAAAPLPNLQGIPTLNAPDASAPERPRGERALRWLGYRVERDGGEASAAPLASATAMRRQRFLDVLGIPTDEFAKKVLANERVEVAAKDDTAPLPFGFAAWRDVLPKEPTPDGALLLFTKDVKASRLLVALASVDDPTRALLKTGVGWKLLYSDRDLLDAFTRCPEALSARGGRFVLPGGRDAEPVWREIVGVSPGDGAREFVRALFSVDDGKAAYVADALQQLPEPAARAFLVGNTGGGERAVKRFRRLYRAIEGGGGNHERMRRDPYDFAHLARFLRFSDDGDVVLPGGGAAVWQAALASKTFPRSDAELEEIVASARGRAGAPEDFLRLLFSRPMSGGPKDYPPQRRFLIVSSLLEERPALAEPGLVVLLFRGLDRFQAAYAVLEDLPLEDAAPARRLLFALDRLERRTDNRDREVAAGLFQCALELLAELAHASELGPGTAKDLLDALLSVPLFAGSDVAAADGAEPMAAWIFDRLLPAARSIAARPAAASASIGNVELRGTALPVREAGSPDDVLDRALSGTRSPARFAFRGGSYVADPATDELERRREFQRRQHLASLDAIREAIAARRLLRQGTEGPARAEATHRLAEALDLLGAAGPPGPDDRVDRTLARAREAIAAGDGGAALDAAIAERLLEALLGHVYAAAAGDPEDLYYQDPDFVRRHSFRTESVAGRELRNAFSPTALSVNQQGRGSRVTGSVFDLADVLGLLHAEQIVYAPEASIPNEEARAGLVGPVRRMSAARLDDDALIVLAASCRATEDLVRALDERPADERARILVELGRGLVPPARLGQVAAAGSARLDALSPSDLYRIGRRLAEGTPPVPLPAADEARDARERLTRRLGERGAHARLAELGPRAVTFAGRSRLADLELPSYERLATYRYPQLFFDRLYDLKVAVARRVREAGYPAGVLPIVLTRALDEEMSSLSMSYAYEWQPSVAAARAFQTADVERHLEAALAAGRLVREGEGAAAGAGQ